MTISELIAEVRRLSDAIEDGIDQLTAAANAEAQAEHAYRLVKAQAWVNHPTGTVPERTARVDAACAASRRARDLASGQKLAALESLRSRRQQLSAAQSVAAAWRAEAEMTRYAPEVNP